jgi:hypothetical protein
MELADGNLARIFSLIDDVDRRRLYSLVDEAICAEANGKLGWEIIQHLIHLDHTNRWMEKYHLQKCAYAIPQVGLLIDEVLSEGNKKAFYTRKGTNEQFNACLQHDLGIITEVVLESGARHSIVLVAFDEKEKSLLVFWPLRTSQGGELGGFKKLTLESVLQLNAGSPVVISGSFNAEQQNKILTLGVPMVDPCFDWREFEKYGMVLQEVRQVLALGRRQT